MFCTQVEKYLASRKSTIMCAIITLDQIAFKPSNTLYSEGCQSTKTQFFDNHGAYTTIVEYLLGV
jgi:hypothetical protein